MVQAAGVYHLASFLAVVLCLVVTIFSTIKGYEEISFTVLFYLESVILVQYSLEYILRLWSCGTHGRFKGLKGMALIPGSRISFKLMTRSGQKLLLMVEPWIGRLRYARQFFPILDLTTLILTAIVFSAGQAEEDGNGRRVLATSVLRALRFLQVVRMMRVDRRGSSWKLLGGVLSTHSKELATAIYLGLLTLVFLRMVSIR